MGELKPVDYNMIKVGSPIAQSIYLKSGDLLFKHGRMVTSQRQKKVLVAQGFFLDEPELVPPKPAPSADVIPTYALNHAPPPAKDTIFDVKERWLGELYHIFKLAREPLVVSFSYQITKLANEIQWVCEYHQDALLAAFHIDSESDYGLLHALHRAIIGEVIAKQSDLTRNQRLPILCGALTHDLGMADIQTALHHQKSALTDEQVQQLKQHPLESHKELSRLGVDDKDWLDIALHHHERIDGSGYPHNLTADAIPLSVKIASVADTYTALVRPTNSRTCNSGKKALAILYKERSVSLDAGLIDKLINIVGIFPIGALVRLNNGEIGVVVKSGKKISQPVVSILQSANLKIIQGRRLRDIQDEQFTIADELSLADYPSLVEPVHNQWTAVI